MNLYVSNLNYNLTDVELREAFERFGAVTHARIILDRESGRSRGFAFVEMANDDEARAAINGLNNIDVGGRPLKVVEARPKEDRPFQPRANFAGGGGGGGAGGGGYKSGGGGGGGGGGFRDKGKGWDRGGKRGGGNFGEESEWS